MQYRYIYLVIHENINGKEFSPLVRGCRLYVEPCESQCDAYVAGSWIDHKLFYLWNCAQQCHLACIQVNYCYITRAYLLALYYI